LETKFQEEFSKVVGIRYPRLQLEIVSCANIVHKRGVCLKREKKVYRGTVGANAPLQHPVNFVFVYCLKKPLEKCIV